MPIMHGEPIPHDQYMLICKEMPFTVLPNIKGQSYIYPKFECSGVLQKIPSVSYRRKYPFDY